MTDDATTPDVPTDPAREGRIEKLTQAITFALLTGNEQPYPIPVPAVRNMAVLLDDCGLRQTDQVAATVKLPGWVTERVREESTPVPAEPDHHAMQETPRVCEAPAPPKRIAKKAMATVTSQGLR
ncbi:hypothetical protein [Williamsia deligens]|uniref:Uncharacterized protein n=1 Tax=Williamsia deligens TaxID=321325 RepID=A0ABW3GD38_9NOCA|nr:hypothetical protein [Williamsia deligens]MCP2196316.1 hypothetical protein [Williamsia deligens]